MAEVMQFKVIMHCEGCAGSVRKGLKKIPGVQSYTVDYTQQMATVVGTADPEEIMSRLRRSGKSVSLIGRAPAPALVVEAPKEPVLVPAAEPEVEAKPVREVKPRKTFRQRMPKMPAMKMPDFQKRKSSPKTPDQQKRMGTLCDRMPKNVVTNACREFMSKGVFYAALDDVSDTELESLKGHT